MVRLKPIWLIMALLTLVSISGCIWLWIDSSNNRYEAYLSELMSGNDDFSKANEHYSNAIKDYNSKYYSQAISEMNIACEFYNDAYTHYSKMESLSENDDQRKYAVSLKLQAENCLYAGSSYSDAYKAFLERDIKKGNSYIDNANHYLEQAKQYYESAAAYESVAIK